MKIIAVAVPLNETWLVRRAGPSPSPSPPQRRSRKNPGGPAFLRLFGNSRLACRLGCSTQQQFPPWPPPPHQPTYSPSVPHNTSLFRLCIQLHLLLRPSCSSSGCIHLQSIHKHHKHPPSMRVSTITSALATLSLVAGANAISPIVQKGRYFFTQAGNRWFIKGMLHLVLASRHVTADIPVPQVSPTSSSPPVPTRILSSTPTSAPSMPTS